MLDFTKTKEADYTKVVNTIEGQEKKDALLMTVDMISQFVAQQRFGQVFIQILFVSLRLSCVQQREQTL